MTVVPITPFQGRARVYDDLTSRKPIGTYQVEAVGLARDNDGSMYFLVVAEINQKFWPRIAFNIDDAAPAVRLVE